MKGRKPELHADPNALAYMKPASWLGKHARAEWRRVMPELVKRQILTTADLGSLEAYCVAVGRIRELELLLRKGIDPQLHRMQNQSMVTARQLAGELGLTPTSRSRPSVRDNDNTDDSSNPLTV